MKLLELVGVKKYYDTDQNELLHLMATVSPFSKQGEGFFSAVFERDNVVYKFWLSDTAYESYVKLVSSSPRNPAFPKFKSQIKKLTAFFKRSQQTPNTVKYIKLEKLYKAYHEDAVVVSTKNDNIVELELVLLLTCIKRALKFSDYEKFEAEVWKEVANLEYVPEEPDFPEKVVNLLKAIFLVKTKITDEHSMDIKVDNVMWRAKQLVLIDPVYNGDDASLNSDLKKLWQDAKDFGVKGPLRTGPRWD